MMNDIIIKPLITEKMTRMTERYPNRYGFLVRKDANKIEIKNTVEALYGVKVNSVNTIVRNGKKKSRYTKKGFIKGSTATHKKAIVDLMQGDTIDFFSNI